MHVCMSACLHVCMDACMHGTNKLVCDMQEILRELSLSTSHPSEWIATRFSASELCFPVDGSLLDIILHAQARHNPFYIFHQKWRGHALPTERWALAERLLCAHCGAKRPTARGPLPPAAHGTQLHTRLSKVVRLIPLPPLDVAPNRGLHGLLRHGLAVEHEVDGVADGLTVGRLAVAGPGVVDLAAT